MIDEPLIPGTDAEEARIGTVIDLDGVRIRWGRSKNPQIICKHNTLVYCDAERRIWCEDCKRTLDNFDAAMRLVRGYQGMTRSAHAMMDKAQKAMASTVRRRAAKQLDHLWNGPMVPNCPHCGGGLLPDDFADGASSSQSKELELARRKRDGPPRRW